MMDYFYLFIYLFILVSYYSSHVVVNDGLAISLPLSLMIFLQKSPIMDYISPVVSNDGSPVVTDDGLYFSYGLGLSDDVLQMLPMINYISPVVSDDGFSAVADDGLYFSCGL